MIHAPLRIAEIYVQEGEFCLEALLECTNPACGVRYPVANGVPIVLKDVGAWWEQNRGAVAPLSSTHTLPLRDYFAGLYHESPSSFRARAHLGTFMEFHFGQFLGSLQTKPSPPVSNAAYWERVVATVATTSAEPALKFGRSMDLGCSVGRFTFELALRSDLAVGLDTDLAKVTAAARIQRGREIAFERRERGRTFRLVRGPYEAPQNVLFLVGDALDPPFAAASFDLVGALGLLDSVGVPLVLLGQMNALLQDGGTLLLGCPFEWRTEIADPSEWLETDDCDAPSILRRLMQGDVAQETGFHYSVESECDDIPWTLRSHARLYSVLHSHLMRARKKGSPCQARDV